ncbi:MAG: T9SS type A sorting domain-containing protein [Sphingobacteriales bacterium]|nr:MAG: T9SS type A sorting domain-containing protein [Sphingobacteriales bacterium]
MKRIFLSLTLLVLIVVAQAQQKDNDLAISLVTANSEALGLKPEDISNSIVSNTYYNEFAGTQMVYLQQGYLGLPVHNQIQSLAFKNGKLISAAGERISGMPAKAGLNAIPSLSPEDAVLAALKAKQIVIASPVKGKAESNTLINYGKMGVSREDVTARLQWVKNKSDKMITLVWQVYLVPVKSDDYFQIRIDANSGKVHSEDNLTVYCNILGDHDHAEHAAKANENVQDEAAGSPSGLLSPNLVGTANYRVIPFPAESRLHTGGAPALVTNPWLLAPGNATSLGWHNDGGFDYNTTRGNNVFAQEDRDNNNSTFGTPAVSTTSPDPLNFNFVPDFTVVPTQTTPIQNQQFNITNLFYWNNITHDLSYLYGFNEVAGNFQNSNQGRGGSGSDYVIADAQDAGGTSNANFATPPDGQRPRMQMYLWGSAAGLQRDGSADNGVIVHEYGHGISNRLTGGPAQAACLQNEEDMGEGWSDYLGLMYTQDWANSNLNSGFSTPRGVATYAGGQNPSGPGIRTQRYSTNMAVNSLVYMNSIPAESHDRGELWCAVLWDMTWNIINQTGVINPSLFTTTGNGGNSIALKLVMEGMKLQPCSPGFIDGRNAILQADQILYGGQYACAIKEAFRRRGMGANASQGSSDDVTDQRPDYSGGTSVILTQGGITSVPEGQNIVYTNTVLAPCETLTNYVLRDTLPANVTWVSGGTYDNATRIVSWDVNIPAGGSQTYSFTVTVNSGSYFPTTNLFEETVPSSSFPATMTNTSTPSAGNWVVSSVASKSAPNSLFTPNLTVAGDQRLFSVNAFAIPANSSPRLNFWHRYNTEDGWDGGVVEVSTNNGLTWRDLATAFVTGGYNSVLGNAPTNVLSGRAAFSGSTGGAFINSVAKLTTFAGQNIKLRFRFGSDNNTAGSGSNPGWFVDDIRVINQAVVDMRSGLHNASNVLVSYSDTTTIITEQATCTNVAVGTQPANSIVCAGANATFTVTATGTSPSYQWQVSTDGSTWNNITGATTSTLTITGATQGMNNNRYRVVISNACPSNITSASATLTVSTPAAITTQPANVTACTGGPANFLVTATGSGLTYQWQVSTDGGTNYTNITGATSATLNISPLTVTHNGNLYRVVITSCSGALNSNAAVLTVNEAVAITGQPTNQNICSGNDAVFTVVASGTSPAYQWQVSTGSGFTNITGATTATLTITGVTPSQNNNQYRVIVSNACPSNTTSAAATLSVSVAGSITAQPSNQTICAGETASFTVAATGTNLTYQWQVSNDGGGTYNNITGANSGTLTLTPVPFSSNGNRYRVVVTSCSGPANSNAAILTVNEPATITTQPANVTACAGDNATFVVATAGPGVTYQWQVSTNGGTTFINIAGETGSSLTLNAITTGLNSNQYRVVVSNSCVSALNSNAATLTISANATISIQPAPVTVCAGSDATFTVAATGAVAYQWQVSTNGGSTFTNVTGATNSTLSLTAVTAVMNANQYLVQVSGCGGGLTSVPVSLTVNNAGSITTHPTSQSSICPGATATFSVVATGTSLTYQWQVSTDNGNAWTNLPGETNTTLSIVSSAAMNGNQYRVVVNGLCTVNLPSNAATLNIVAAPVITSQPQNIPVCETGSASFTVTATNGTLQWEVSTDGGANFTAITGATSATLSVPNVTASMHNNQYRVVVTGACSSLTSNTATLTVTTTPNIGVNGPAAAVCAGETITLSGTGANSYTWNNGVTDGVPFAIQQTTTYTVTGTAAGNCSGTATITVTVNQPPVVTLSATQTELEPGDSAIITASANPAATTFQWFRNGQLLPGETGNTITVYDNETGAYTASAVGANECTGVSSILEIVPADLDVTFISPNPNNGRFIVRYPNLNTTATSRAVLVYDAKGARIFHKVYPISQGTMVEIMEVDLRNVSKGIYLVALVENGKKVKSGKILVQ